MEWFEAVLASDTLVWVRAMYGVVFGVVFVVRRSRAASRKA